MVRKLMTALLVGSAVMAAGCNMVRGAAADVNSVANCAENTMNNGRC